MCKDKKFTDTILFAALLVLALCFISVGFPLIMVWIMSDTRLLIAFVLGILAVMAFNAICDNI